MMLSGSSLLCIFLIIIILICQGQGSYFYIYDWPKELDDVWPPAGAALHNKSGYSHEFRGHSGAGKMIKSDIGLFQTWQFSLFRNLMSRLRTSEYRTLDPSKAVAFIIPFDLGVHSYIDHLTGFPRLASPYGWKAGALLRNASYDTKLYWKNQGHDHFVIFSITAYQMVGIGVKVFFMQICQNCTTITIETSPTLTAIKGRTRKWWYASPYPSSYHWHENIKTLPWISQNSADSRPNLVLIIGSLRTSQPTSNNLRKTLFTQCSQDPSCQWHKTAHSCNGVINAQDVMEKLREAVFCPAPTGDSVTRKSVFDALVSGCIPVLFSRATLSQYSWFVSEEEVDAVSVYIPIKSINIEGANFIDILKKIPKEDILKKQKLIESIAPRLQYSVVPDRYLIDEKVWRPPLRDAAAIVIEKIIDRKTIEPINGFSDEELNLHHDKQVDIMDNHEDYASLRSVSKINGDTEKEKELKKKKRKVAVSKIIPADQQYVNKYHLNGK